VIKNRMASSGNLPSPSMALALVEAALNRYEKIVLAIQPVASVVVEKFSLELPFIHRSRPGIRHYIDPPHSLKVRLINVRHETRLMPRK
jgi:hypothetical protein